VREIPRPTGVFPGSEPASNRGHTLAAPDAGRSRCGRLGHRAFRCAHAGLGGLLRRGHCDPLATGLQWLKAGAHAHTPGQMEAVARGIAAARAASADPAQFDTALCGYVG